MEMCLLSYIAYLGSARSKSVSLKYLNVNSILNFEVSRSFVAHSDETLVVEEGGITRIQ